MYKNYEVPPSLYVRRRGAKIWKIMKLIAFFMVLGTMCLHASGYAQRVTLDLKNSSLEQALKTIGKQSGYHVLYNPLTIDKSKRVSLNLKNASLDDALKRVFADQPLVYTVSKKTIVVKEKPRVKPVPVKIIAEESKQQQPVIGVVSDSIGPIQGVSVVVKGGSANGTTTNQQGYFTVQVPDNNVTLIFTMVGYETQEIPLNGRTELQVKLRSVNADLEEVVVVGYGTQRRSDVTGAISSVESTTIARAATADATGALQGQTPGAVVVKNVGKPGSGYNINIRGISSFGGSNSPLFVIDGIPTTSGLNDINPADIEKIDVLKDASATAIYGSRGAKGVVIVTTKRGKQGQTTIAYDGYAGARKPTNLPDMMNGEQYVKYRTDQFLATGRDTSRSNNAFFTPAQWANIDAGHFTDWPGMFLKDGRQMNHNVSASGGDEQTRFSLGLGFLQEGGNVSPEDFKRYSFRGNIDKNIGEKWMAGMSFYAAQNLQNLGSSETLRSAYRLPPTVSPYDSDGNPVFRVLGGDGVTNPLFDADNDIRDSRGIRAFGQIYLQVKPLPYLTLKTTFSPSLNTDRFAWYFGSESKEGAGNGGYNSSRNNSTSEQVNWLWDNQAIYERTLEGGHKLTATVIQSMQKDRTESSGIDVYNLPYNSLWYNFGSATNTDFNGTFRGPTVRSDFVQYTLASVRGRVNYSFNDMYLLTLSGTWDGSSRLAEGNKWGFFPSASAAWRISQTEFIQQIGAINDLKLRLSYGASGNDRVDPYITQATLGASTYFFGNALVQGYSPNRLANKLLTWETTKEINLGLDFGFLGNRIYGTIDLYDRKIHDILLNRNLPAPSGWESVSANMGKLRNRGLEVGLTTVNVQTDKFSWKTDFVFDANKNEILETANGKADDIGNAFFIGHPVQVNYNYVFDGVWQESERDIAAGYNQLPGQVRVKDLDNNGVINAEDRQIIGKRVPTWTGSFATTFRYGNIDLYAMAYIRRGEQFNSSFNSSFMNYNQIYNQVNVDYWTPDNPSQTHFQPGTPGTFVNVAYFRKADFVRISNITLGYTVPTSLISKYKINSLRFYATATNPFLFTDYEGYDPEWAAQNTYGTAISTSSYLFGVNVSF